MKFSEVSIIIPVYNSELYIERSIRSAIKNRNLIPSLEIVVVNDGSTDLTSEILKKFEENDDIVLIEHKENMGLPSALNTGIVKSTGQFIIRLDSDDFVLENYCYLLSCFLKNNNNLDAVRCDYYLVDKLQNIVKRVNAEDKPIGCGIMFRREQLIDIGLYDPEKLLHEDKELEERFKKKYSISSLPIALYKYFIHGKNMTLLSKD